MISSFQFIQINLVGDYFEKQIYRIERLKQKVSQEVVSRMKIGEIENLKSQRDEKMAKLENQKEIKSSFEILGIVGIG